MTKNFYILKIITTLAFFCLTTLTHADVIRCEDSAGDVTYTNTECGNDVQASQLLFLEKPSVKNVSYQQPSKTVQERSSSWANIYIAPRSAKVDNESVRSARMRMISMDSSSPYLAMRK